MKQIEQRQCETIYEADDGFKVRLQAIVGGTLGLWSENYEVIRRYNYSEKHDSQKANWMTWEPPVIDDLDGGIETVKEFISDAKKIIAIRDKRYNIIRKILVDDWRLRKAFRNDDKERIVATWELHDRYCSPVTGVVIGYRCQIPHTYGRCDEKIAAVATPEWLKLQEVSVRIFDSTPNWESMSDDAFDELVEAIKAVKEAG